MKKFMNMAVAVLVLVMMGCAADRAAVDKDYPDNLLNPTSNAKGPQSGEASTDLANTKVLTVPGVGWGANNHVTPTAVAGEYSPQHGNTKSGDLQTGLITASNPQLVSMMAEWRNSDPAIKASTDEIALIFKRANTVGEDGVPRGLTEADQARIDLLKDQIGEAHKRITEMGQGLSGDFSSLESIINFNFSWGGNVGHDERAPTDVEAQAMSKWLVDLVLASQKLDTIQQEGVTLPPLAVGDQVFSEEFGEEFPAEVAEVLATGEYRVVFADETEGTYPRSKLTLLKAADSN